MNIANFLSVTILILTFQNQTVFSQIEKHSFKIVGETINNTFLNSQEGKSVEYDSVSADHLFISYFNKEGIVTSRRQFKFNGKRFDLAYLPEYFAKKEIIPDGITTIMRQDGTTSEEMIYKNGSLQQKTLFYETGSRFLYCQGDGKILNGTYQIWHPNGQLSFSGIYKNDLKDGEFQEFDSSGTLIKTGVYQDGKLISGEPVIQNVVFENPEKPARLGDGDKNFDEFLKSRSSENESMKDLKTEKKIYLNLTFDKTGVIRKIENLSILTQTELNILNEVFREFPIFSPATVENIPVESILPLILIMSKDGIRIDNEVKNTVASDIYTEVDEMPQFPGGQEALFRYIALSVRYPVEAQTARIEGKVFVNYVVNENGEVTNIRLMRGVNMYLDAEALRVVRTMPKWSPGRMNGIPVKVSFTIPIGFRLQ